MVCFGGAVDQGKLHDEVASLSAEIPAVPAFVFRVATRESRVENEA